MAHFIPLPLVLRACMAGALSLGPLATVAAAPPGALAALSQAQGLPREFEAHFFDAPLAVRVDLDGRYLGDALIVLGRDGRVQLLEFTDLQDSQEPAATRRRWQERLADGRELGDCRSDCPDGLRAIHYSLVNSQLSVLTDSAERGQDSSRYHRLPEAGSNGLLLRNQLNLVGGAGQTSGRLGLQGQGSIGNWTALADAQFDRGQDQAQGTRHRLEQLYAERVHEERFYRLGYFTPGAQGLTRQPRLYGNSPDTTLGMMFGSSDSLLMDAGQPSATPIYVTPNRPGVVEIYRNGVLINSQAVQPGLQTLDTRVLPAGIYEVEVRLLEDGQESSRTQEFIYKPSNWSNADSRWRYNVYAGRQTSLVSNWDRYHEDSLSAGVLTNYLLHPRAVLGLSAQRVNEFMQYGTSLDWDLLERLKLYGNVYQTDGRGRGYDLQLINSYDGGSWVFSHSRTQVEPERSVRRQRYAFLDTTQTSLSLNQRITQRSTATVRLSHSTGASSGTGIDLGWAFYGKLLGSDANWRLSVFDRPGTAATGAARSRGVNLSLSMSLGEPGRRFGATLGSRTSRDGERDQNASLTYQQDVELGALRTVSGTASFDRYGTGISTNGQFDNQYLFGDAYAQRSSYNGEFTGGLNLQSTLALGGGALAATGEYQVQDAGLIVDVDTDLPELKLRANDVLGGSTVLRPGRNVIPVTAYKAGNVQFDFEHDPDVAAAVQPSSLDYHLNRGGVEYRELKVLRTVTVLGRLLDGQGQPLRGVQVINHASRSVSEADGYFTLELSASNPSIEVRQHGQSLCSLVIDTRRSTREGELLLAGERTCEQAGIAQAGAAGAGKDI